MGSSIEDVAALAGVSTATVSRALRGLPRVSADARQRVMAAVLDLGYVPSPSARGLASGRTKTVGVLVPYINRWYFAHALEGIEQVLRAHDYNLLLYSLGGYFDGKRRHFTETMVRKQIDGLVVLSLGLSENELRQLQNTAMPVISVGGPVEGCPGVYIDDTAAATAAAEHLVALGHRRIGNVHGGQQDLINFKVPALRTKAFETVLERHSLECRHDWTAAGDYSVAGGAEAAARILDAPGEKVTAIFAGSDEMALGVLFEAQRRGMRIPEDLSIIGIDGHEMAEPAGLSTIAQSPWEHGREAATLLLAELAGVPESIRDVIVPFELKARRSTAAPQH